MIKKAEREKLKLPTLLVRHRILHFRLGLTSRHAFHNRELTPLSPKEAQVRVPSDEPNPRFRGRSHRDADDSGDGVVPARNRRGEPHCRRRRRRHRLSQFAISIFSRDESISFFISFTSFVAFVLCVWVWVWVLIDYNGGGDVLCTLCQRYDVSSNHELFTYWFILEFYSLCSISPCTLCNCSVALSLILHVHSEPKLLFSVVDLIVNFLQLL